MSQVQPFTPECSEAIFRTISNFPGYGVDIYGSVWSRWIRGSYRKSLFGPWHRLSLVPGKRGRLSVCLVRDGRRFNKFVHHLVLETFVGPCPPGLECCHWDGNPANNRLDNLRWDTHQANTQDKLRHGTYPVLPLTYGDRNPSTKHSEKQVMEMRQLRSEGLGVREIARRFNADSGHVSRILNGRTRKQG